MNIKTASALTGISRDMIRFYEKKGIIHPARNPENRYRDYQTHDIHTLILIRQYNAMGINLNTIASLINERNLNDAVEELNAGIDQLREESLWAEARLHGAEYIRSLFSLIQSDTPYEFKEHHEFYYYPIAEQDRMMPHVETALSVFRFIAPMQNGTKKSDTGNLYSRRLPEEYRSAEYYPKGMSFRMILHQKSDCLAGEKEIRKAEQIIREHGYYLSGDILIYQIITAGTNRSTDIICLQAIVTRAEETDLK